MKKILSITFVVVLLLGIVAYGIISSRNRYNELNADAIALNKAMDILKKKMNDAETEYQAEVKTIEEQAEQARALLAIIEELESKTTVKP